MRAWSGLPASSRGSRHPDTALRRYIVWQREGSYFPLARPHRARTGKPDVASRMKHYHSPSLLRLPRRGERRWRVGWEGLIGWIVLPLLFWLGIAVILKILL